MRRPSQLAAVVMSLMLVLLMAALRAEQPAKKVETVKPPWQRYLQGADAKKAAEQEKKLAQLQEAGQFAEALKLAETLAELRTKAQGAGHWEVATARSTVEEINRVLNAEKEGQQSYCRAFALQRQARELEAKGRSREAQPLREQVLAIKRKVLGEKYLDTATSYNDAAANLSAQGKYREAEEGFWRALAIHRKVLREEHPSTALIYNNLASSLSEQSKYKEAGECFGKALAIQRKVLGEEHSDTAASYNNAAANLHLQGKYRKAEEGFYRALAIRRKVLGEEHSDTALSYSWMGNNLLVQGKYKEAEEGCRKALAIYRKVLGEEHPSTALSYNSVAVILSVQSKYEEAEESYRKALAIQSKLLGEEHPQTALSYLNLAINLSTQSKYREAEEGFRKALVVYRKVRGEVHPDTAFSYSSLARNLSVQSKYKEAEESLRKALAIQSKLLGEEHPQTAKSYENMAYNLKAQGNYKEAEENYRKALSINRKVLGEEHPELAMGYNSFALCLSAEGKYDEAEESLHKALAIQSKLLGETHHDTATSYNNVAVNLTAQGKYKEAETAYRRALAICRKVLGEEHSHTSRGYNNLADNLHAQGKYREAETFLLHAADSFAKARLRVASTGLERAAFTSEDSPLPVLAAVLARTSKPDNAWQRLEESLARGTWDDLNTRLRLSQTERDKQAQITARIDRLQKLLEKTSIAKPAPEQMKQREKLLTQLRQAYDELSAFGHELEKKYGPVAGQVFPRRQIQQSLSADAALIAWLDIAGQPKAADPNGEHWAILLRSSGDPVWVRLHGSGDNHAWTTADTQLPAMLRNALQDAESDWQPLAQRLRKQRFEPLAQHLKGVRRLIVLPSAALAGVPLEVIADGYTISYAHSATMYAHLRPPPALIGKGLFVLADPVFDPPTLAEQPQPLPPSGVLLTVVAPGGNAAKAGLKPNDVLLRYGDTDLNAVADLKPQPDSKDPKKLVPVVVWRDGGKLSRPLFVSPGKLGVVIAKEPAPQAVAEQRRINRLLASRSGDDGNWPRLPGTRIEAVSLQRLFGKDAPTQILLDSDASEQRIDAFSKRGELNKYRYIHFATHGEVDNVFPLRSAVILSRDHLPDDKQRTELLLSGQPIPDGRLTAEDALRRWNLNAELVTLSACQTALGKYERGEGFVGFAQALILCGTRSVCLSLWKVDDVATALLMERFYQNLLGKRDGLKKAMSKAAALSEAKSWLRTLPREEAVKRAASLTAGVSRGKGAAKLPPLQVPAAAKAEPGDPPFAHPRDWAAFILIGHAD